MLRVALVGLLLVSMGAAAAPLHGVLEVSQVRGVGDVTAEAGLVAVLREATEPSPEFHLQAEELRVEVDVADPTVYTGLTWHNAKPTTEEDTYRAAAVEGSAVRPSYQWLLVPLEDQDGATFAVEGTCLEAEASREGIIERTSNADGNRPPTSADASEATVLEPCEAAMLTVRGDFLLALWEWDSRITTDSGEPQDLWSGRRQSSYDPLGTPESGATISESREVFFYASNAVLQVPFLTGDVAYGNGGNLDALGTTTASDAKGTLTTGQETLNVDGAPLYVEGDIHVALQAVQHGLSADLSGSVEQVQVSGSQVALPADADLQVLAWPWMAALAILIVGLVSWKVVPRFAYVRALNREERPWQTQPRTPGEERAMHWYALGLRFRELGVRRVALWSATRAVRRAPHVPDHRYLRALILKTLGRRERHIKDLQKVVGLLSPGQERARVARMLARACQECGRDEEARTWWITVRRDSPMLFLASSNEEGFKRLGLASPVWDAPDVA